MASEPITEHLVLKLALGEHAPRPSCMWSSIEGSCIRPCNTMAISIHFVCWEREGTDTQSGMAIIMWSYMQVVSGMYPTVPHRAFLDYTTTAGLVDWLFHVKNRATLIAIKWDLLTCRFCHDSFSLWCSLFKPWNTHVHSARESGLSNSLH